MAREVDYDLIDIDWWQERDRHSVVVYENDDREVTLFEVWDDEVPELIEDGFFKWEDDDSVIDYMEELGLIKHVSIDDDDDEEE